MNFHLDRSLLLAVFALMGLGLVQIYSASYIFAFENYSDGLYFFKRQLLFSLCATAVLLTISITSWKWKEKWGYLLWVVGTIGVIATYVPGLGHEAGGAARWIQLPGGYKFEPAELLKISLPFLFAFFATREMNLSNLAKWTIRLLSFALPMVLLLKQPDFGSFTICVSVLMALLFIFGLKFRFILASVMVAIPAFYFLIMNVPYRRARVLSFLDPWKDSSEGGFQVIQSMLSFHSGSFSGQGLGQAQGKLFFLPEAHTDFTFSILAEETGFVGVTLVLALFGFVVLRSFQIGMNARTLSGRIVALGVSSAFTFQFLINSGVVMGLLPTKGLTLPFLSYGGSSLLMMGVAFGLLLNIDRDSRQYHLRS
jgi:cell division protein FtsW